MLNASKAGDMLHFSPSLRVNSEDLGDGGHVKTFEWKETMDIPQRRPPQNSPKWPKVSCQHPHPCLRSRARSPGGAGVSRDLQTFGPHGGSKGHIERSTDFVSYRFLTPRINPKFKETGLKAGELPGSTITHPI